MLAVDPLAQLLIDSANQYAISRNAADNGRPMVPLYTDFQAGGTYGSVDASVAVNLDGNDPDAGRGTSSFRMTATAVDAFFQFGLGVAVANRPRDDAAFGLVRGLRFLAKAQTANQQLTVKVFRTTAGGFQQVAAQTFTLTTSWQDLVLTLPASPALAPKDLHAVQFVMPTAGTVRLDEVRLSTDGFDRLRVLQSYTPAGWAATNSDPNTPAGRDVNVYSNRSFLYDVAVAMKALIATHDPAAQQVARDMVDAILATAADGTNGYFDERNSGHVLLGNGQPRAPFSQQRSLGANSWFGLALLEVYQLTGDARYLTRAGEISLWADTQLKATGPLKGYWGGFDASGARIPWRSTEHNIDFFQFNRELARIHGEYLNPFLTHSSRATHAGDFVVAMFDPVDGKLWTGTSTGDTINTSSVPLDAQLWASLTLAQSSQYASVLDWSRPVQWAEQHLVPTDGPLSGFTFSSQSTPNRVWLEGVAHGAVAYQVLGDLAKAGQSMQTLNQARLGNGGLPAASSDALTDPSLGAIYDRRAAVAPTAWAFLAERQRNPFEAELVTVRQFQGDFDGDGTQDVAGFTADGQWRIGLSQGDQFAPQPPALWTQWSALFSWHHLAVGDFNGDGKDDVAGLNFAGQWFVGLSTGSAFVTGPLWGYAWATPSAGSQLFVGDFNGDSRDDVASFSAIGRWWVGLSTRSTFDPNLWSFETSLWAEWSISSSWDQLFVGDFNGDQSKDVAGFGTNGKWFIGRSTGSAFTTTLWAQWSIPVSWHQLFIGDFNNDDRDDIAGFGTNGKWFVGLSTASVFTTTLWAQWSIPATWDQLFVSDFNGDGRSDIAGFDVNGKWWVGLATAASTFATGPSWAQWSPPGLWKQLFVGDFTGDGMDDVAGFAFDDTWWVGVADGNEFATGPSWAQW